MWMIAHYFPVAPFSLKPTMATSSGGKTLLTPTPYAIKMALLDVAIRTLGIGEGERLFPRLRDLSISLELPSDLVVMKGFSRSRRPYESKDSQKKEETREEFEERQLAKLADKIEKGQYPFYSTIAYREYVYYRDSLQLALSAAEGDTLPEELRQLLVGINYFGKRGGFFQIMEQPRLLDDLPSDRFINLTPDKQFPFRTDGTLQMLDDCDISLTFRQANITSADRITVGKERILRHVVLPYRLVSSSRSYSWYQYTSWEPEGQ